MTLEPEQTDILLSIAEALGELQNEVVYVGGAVLGCYANKEVTEVPRPTKDVDIVAEIYSLLELESLRMKLKERGFIQSHEDSVICRFRYNGNLVDVMSTREIGWAPANRWFAPGSQKPEVVLIKEVSFRLLSFPYYLGTKFDAFHGRGGDPRMSSDFEDIVFSLNN